MVVRAQSSLSIVTMFSVKWEAGSLGGTGLEENEDVKQPFSRENR